MTTTPIYPHPAQDDPLWLAYGDPLQAFRYYLHMACLYWDEPNLRPDPTAPDFERAAYHSAHSPLVHAATYDRLNGGYLWYTRIEVSRPIQESMFRRLIDPDHLRHLEGHTNKRYAIFRRGALALLGGYYVAVFSFQICTPEVVSC